MSPTSERPAVFIDRDNTLIRDPGYLREVDHVQLLPGAAESIRRLRAAGYPVIVVTNQSGIARGYLTEEDLTAIHDRMKQLLAVQGAAVDAIYYCPYLNSDDAVRAEYRVESELRKPRPGMLLLAAREHALDLSRSWMIGDGERDVQAGKAAGCRSILLSTNGAAASTVADHVTGKLSTAVDIVLSDRAPASPPPPAPADPPPKPETPVALPPASPPRPESSLQAVVEELRHLRREQNFSHFSLAQLAAAVAQAIALCTLAWGLFAALNGNDEAAKIRLLAAIAFQLVALTGVAAAARK